MDRKKKHVLVVDDDPFFVEAIQTILVNNSYEVSVARNGKEGLEKIRALKPDCVLLDIMMEDPTAGFPVVFKVRQDSEYEEVKNTPIIYLSGIKDITGSRYQFQPYDEEMIKADEYLDKPVDPNVLINTIEKVTKRI